MEHETKRCKSGDACLHPDGPVLPVSEFYAYSEDRHQAMCKECEKEYQRQIRLKPPNLSLGKRIETAVIHTLKNNGIFAVEGKQTSYSLVDVVAWGCVRIEVKSSKDYGGRWMFSFVNQAKKGVKGDIVCLVPLSKSKIPIMYSVFSSDFRAFYKRDGSLKTGVSLIKQPMARKDTVTPLTMNDMYEHEDQWDLVNEVRDRISQELQHGMFNPRRVNAPAEVDLPLFSMGAD